MRVELYGCQGNTDYFSGNCLPSSTQLYVGMDIQWFPPGGGERKLTLFFEDIPMPGSGANLVPIKNLLGDRTNETVRNIGVLVLGRCP